MSDVRDDRRALLLWDDANQLHASLVLSFNCLSGFGFSCGRKRGSLGAELIGEPKRPGTQVAHECQPENCTKILTWPANQDHF